MLDDLTFLRTYDFRRIPRTFFEQVKEMDAGMIDRVYQLGTLIAASPTTLLYVLIDDVYVIHGVLWAEVDLIEAIIFVRLLSVEKEYQSSDGQLLNKAKDFLFNLMGPEMKKEIHFLTDRPGKFEKIGAKRCKRIRMELTNGKDNQDSSERDNISDTSKSAK